MKTLGILLFALTMSCTSLYAQKIPKGNLTYCSIVDEGVAHLGTDIGILTAEPDKIPTIKVTLYENCHFQDATHGEYEVSPQVVKDLQKLIDNTKVYKVDGYDDEEGIDGGHEYSIKVIYDTGENIFAQWHTTSPNPIARDAFHQLNMFFNPWYEKLKNGITTEKLPNVSTSPQKKKARPD